jgi:hypothetical protein
VAGVVGSVGDGLRQVRVEADDVGGLADDLDVRGGWISGPEEGTPVIVGHGPANLTNLGKGKGVPSNQERGFRVPDRLGRCGGRERRRRSFAETSGSRSNAIGYCVCG